MKTAILHLSDLHLTEHKNELEEVINSTWFVPSDHTFENSIIKTISDEKIKKNIQKLYLVISGDLSNSSKQEEYNYTISFLERLIKKLSISKKDILIVPGNHDINWFENEKAYMESEQKMPPHFFFNEKYLHFAAFYNEFFKNEKRIFPTNKYIVDTLLINNKILLIGINSTLCSSYASDRRGSTAKFEINNIETELDEISTSISNFEQLVKVAVFHHNPRSLSDLEKNSTSIKDWPSLMQLFKNNDIRTFLFGHEHTAGANKISSDDCAYIATSSIGIRHEKVDNYISIIEIIDEENIFFQTNYFRLLRDEDKANMPPFGFWNPISDQSYNQKFCLLEKLSITKSTTSESKITNIEDIEPLDEINIRNINSINQTEYSQLLFNEVKQRKIFKSGHFHWSDNAKSHNWLDIPSLLEKKEISDLCKKALVEVIEKNKIRTDLILGVGMEGCFLSANVALKIGVPFCFIPYEFRYNDHDINELEINHAPVDNLTIIIDVLNTGSTIKNMLNIEKDKGFFETPKTINIISLFYTGIKAADITLLQTIDTRINYYFVCDKFQVHHCHYGKDFRDKCIIYSNKLAKVYEFYSKSE